MLLLMRTRADIYDTFAKYALEEVANRFQDWWYEQDESEFD